MSIATIRKGYENRVEGKPLPSSELSRYEMKLAQSLQEASLSGDLKVQANRINLELQRFLPTSDASKIANLIVRCSTFSNKNVKIRRDALQLSHSIHKIGNHFYINLKTELGEGAFKTTLDALLVDLTTCTVQQVAQQILHKDLRILGEKSGFFQQFDRESLLQLALTGCNYIPKIIERVKYKKVDGGVRMKVYVERIPRTLENLLEKSPQPPFEKKARIALEIAKGLSELHDLGIMQNGLKPENILLTKDYKIKIIDFGLSASANHLAPGKFIAIAAPEQKRSSQTTVNNRTDVYQYGILLLTLFGPNGFSTFSLLRKRAEEKQNRYFTQDYLPGFFDSWPPSSDAEAKIKELARRATSPDPENRPTIQEIIRTLLAVTSVD